MSDACRAPGLAGRRSRRVLAFRDREPQACWDEAGRDRWAVPARLEPWGYPAGAPRVDRERQAGLESGPDGPPFLDAGAQSVEEGVVRRLVFARRPPVPARWAGQWAWEWAAGRAAAAPESRRGDLRESAGADRTEFARALEAAVAVEPEPEAVAVKPGLPVSRPAWLRADEPEWRLPESAGVGERRRAWTAESKWKARPRAGRSVVAEAAERLSA